MMSLEGVEERGPEVSKAGKPLGHIQGALGASEGRLEHSIVPVGPKHSEDPRLICDLLGHLGKKRY